MKNMTITISADSAEQLDTAVSVLTTMGVKVQGEEHQAEIARIAVLDARDFLNATLNDLDTRISQGSKPKDRLSPAQLKALTDQVHPNMSRERFRELAVQAGWQVVKSAHKTYTRGNEYLQERFLDHNRQPFALTLSLHVGKGMNRRPRPLKAIRTKHCQLLIEGLVKAEL